MTVSTRWTGTITIRTITIIFFVVGALSGLCARSAGAANCPSKTEQIRRDEAYTQQLPDCRAYEQVSPVAKNNTDAIGRAGDVESSPSGESVTFYSHLPLPGSNAAIEFPTYLSTRDGTGWSLPDDLLPPTNPTGIDSSLVGLTEDLEDSIVVVGPEGPLLTGENGDIVEAEPEGLHLKKAATQGQANWYIRENSTNEYRLLAPGSSTSGSDATNFADATTGDGRILFEDHAKLTEGAAPGVTNLYEWENGQVSLVGVLPDSKAPEGGSVAGPGGSAVEEFEPGEEEKQRPGGATSHFYTQDTLSADGARVFFTDVGTGHIYVRELATSETFEVSRGTAYWRAATPSGSVVFYTEGKGSERKLYRLDVDKAKEGKTGEDITSMPGAHVLGTLGTSQTGAYVYFVAEGLLPAKTPQGSKPLEEAANLYEWHEGEVTFIVSLGVSSDYTDWTDFPLHSGGPAEGEKSSRVTPSGLMILFSSVEQLTKYNNEGEHELYLYNALNDKLVCVSCNPSNHAATKEAFLTRNLHNALGPGVRNSFITNNLSTNGGRVFFQTEEALIPNQDTDDQMNVYEWEGEGFGSCKVATDVESGGCLYSISSGTSSDESYFGDASADGSDVFFFTRQSLVNQDQDENVDLYDAREDGGFESQNMVPVSPCEGEGCRGEKMSTPIFGLPTSATMFGSGNLALPPKVKLVTKKKSGRKARPKTKAKKVNNGRRKAKKGRKSSRAHRARRGPRS